MLLIVRPATRLVVAVSFAACNAFVPLPPTSMPIEGVLRDPTGSSSIAAHAWFNGAAIENSFGSGLRFSQQVKPELSVGADASGDIAGTPAARAYYGRARAHLRYHPGDQDHWAVTAGLGGGTYAGVRSSLGPTFMTLDLGIRVGASVGRAVDLYFAESPAVSVLSQSGPITVMMYWATSLGIVVRPTQNLAIGANIDMWLALAPQFATAASPVFVPTVSVRYTTAGWPRVPAERRSESDARRDEPRLADPQWTIPSRGQPANAPGGLSGRNGEERWRTIIIREDDPQPDSMPRPTR